MFWQADRALGKKQFPWQTAGSQRVVSQNDLRMFGFNRHVGYTYLVFYLILPGVSPQVGIKGLIPAVEFFDCVGFLQPAYLQRHIRPASWLASTQGLGEPELPT